MASSTQQEPMSEKSSKKQQQQQQQQQQQSEASATSASQAQSSSGSGGSSSDKTGVWTLEQALSRSGAAMASSDKTLMDRQPGEGDNNEGQGGAEEWQEKDFAGWAEELGLPADDRCYAVGLTLACNRHIYRKTRPVDNSYAEYVVPCGAGGRIKPGNSKAQDDAREHAAACPHFRARAHLVYPHPDANVQHGQGSFCRICRLYKDAAWDRPEVLSPRLTWRDKSDADRELLATTTVKGEDATKGKIRLYRLLG